MNTDSYDKHTTHTALTAGAVVVAMSFGDLVLAGTVPAPIRTR